MRISDWSSDVCSSDLGRVRPTSGRVLFHGEAIQNELEHRIVGKGICRKFQTPGVLIGLSVIDNLAIAAMADRRWWKSFGKAGEDDARAKAEDVLAKVGLSDRRDALAGNRSEEHTSELQSLMRLSYAVFCLKKKNNTNRDHT